MNSKDFYSKIDNANNYDKERFTSHAGKIFDKFEKNFVISNLPIEHNKKILDAGAGTGRFSIEIAKKGFNVVSCDYSNAMLTIINNKSHMNNLTDKIELYKEDITDLSFKDNEFDFISCIRVLVNLDTKDNIIKCLNEFNRVCKNEGIIVLDFVNLKSIASLGTIKDSYITIDEFKEIITSISDLEIVELFGRKILSQTLIEKVPNIFLKPLDKLDKWLSNKLYQFSIRIYVVLIKREV